MQKTPHEYYRQFKPIRNKIQQYDPESIISRATTLLHTCEEKLLSGQVDCLPWHLLLLIKWTMAINYEWMEARTISNKQINQMQFNRLYNLINHLDSPAQKMLEKGEAHSLIKKMRLLAFQQFWLQPQMAPTGDDFARALILFFETNGKYDLEGNFKKFTGIDLRNFFDLSFMTWSYYKLEAKNRGPRFNANWFRNVRQIFPDNEISLFLDQISLDLKSAMQFSSESFSEKGIQFQVTEQTPFKAKPVLKLDNDQYMAFYPPLLGYFIVHSMYDLFKANDGEKFSPDFGKRMEKYIQKGIDILKVPYHTDDHLKKENPGKPNVDFVIKLDACIILIESKGIEMSHFAKVNPYALENSIKDSVIKGLSQSYSVATDIKQGKILQGCQDLPIYSFVISYKQLYLGNGRPVWEEVFKEPMNKIFQEKGLDKTAIDPKNIFIVSLKEWDLFVATILGQKAENTHRILEEIVNKNDNAETMRLNFSDYLRDYRAENTIVPFHKDKIQLYFDEIIKKMKQN